MKRQSVLEVLGDPASWPHETRGVYGTPNMRDASITKVSVVGDEIRIETDGGSHGPMLSAFDVEDPDLRDRIVRVLRPGLNVYDAVGIEI